MSTARQQDQPQCACETNGRPTPTCPTHAPADTQPPPGPKGWE